METNLSFIDTSCNIRKVANISDLRKIISDSHNNDKTLKNLDLTAVNIRNIDMGGLIIENVIFGYYNVERQSPKVIFNVNFKGCKFNNVSFAQCKLIRCNFDTYKISVKEQQKENINYNTLRDKKDEIIITEINNTDFFLCEFEFCRFRNALINIADFRYTSLVNCSLGGCKIKYGDFYMAAFKGTTSFTECKFMRCCITNTVFEYNCLRMNSIEGLIQEFYSDYSEKLICNPYWHKQNPCADFSYLNEGEDKGNTVKSKEFVRKEASAVYAQLSGYYSGKGLFRDANKAYERAKINEAWANLYSIINNCKSILNCLRNKNNHHKCSEAKIISGNIISLLGFIFSWMFGFGFKIRTVLFWFIMIVVGYMAALHFRTEGCLNWQIELAYSLNNTMGPFDKFTNIFKDDLMACLQTTSGILLVGFMGFVLANRIRNNY